MTCHSNSNLASTYITPVSFPSTLLVNSEGQAVYVKWHLKTDQGIKNLPAAEADRYLSRLLYSIHCSFSLKIAQYGSPEDHFSSHNISLLDITALSREHRLITHCSPPEHNYFHRLASADPDYAIRDLYNAIGNKNPPSWTMYFQVMTYAEAESLPYNPFDLTKVLQPPYLPPQLTVTAAHLSLQAVAT
jgi:hypothetical protein